MSEITNSPEISKSSDLSSPTRQQVSPVRPKLKKGKGKGKGKTSKVRRLSETTAGIVSVIEPMRQDQEDFETEEQRDVQKEQSLRQDKQQPDYVQGGDDVLLVPVELDDITEHQDMNSCQDISRVNDVKNSEGREPISRKNDPVEETEQDENIIPEKEDPSFSQMFPVFEPQEIFPEPEQRRLAHQSQMTRPQRSGKARSSSGRTLRSGKVLTPPDEQDADSQLEALDDKGKLSPVDVLAMIDTWKISQSTDHQEQKTAAPFEHCEKACDVVYMDEDSSPYEKAEHINNSYQDSGSKRKVSRAANIVELTTCSSNRVLESSSGGMDHLLVDESVRSQIHRKALFRKTPPAESRGKIEGKQEQKKGESSEGEREFEGKNNNTLLTNKIPGHSYHESLSSLSKKQTSPHGFVKASDLSPQPTDRPPSFSPPSFLNQSTPVGKTRQSKDVQEMRISSDHESFFQDGEGESAFLDFKTPNTYEEIVDDEKDAKVEVNMKESKKSELKVGSKRKLSTASLELTLTDRNNPTESHDAIRSSVAKDPNRFRTPSPVNPTDITQITFTQAMDCLQTSLDHKRHVSRIGDKAKAILARAETSPVAEESSDEDSPIFSSCMSTSINARKVAEKVPVFDLEMDDGGPSKNANELKSSNTKRVAERVKSGVQDNATEKQNKSVSKSVNESKCDCVEPILSRSRGLGELKASDAENVQPVQSATLRAPNPIVTDEAQFDLGFDFDDEFDDDMIIPPSPSTAPPTQPFSQKSNLEKIKVAEESLNRSQSPGLIGGLFGGKKDTLSKSTDSFGVDKGLTRGDDEQFADIPLSQNRKDLPTFKSKDCAMYIKKSMPLSEDTMDPYDDVPLTQNKRDLTSDDTMDPLTDDIFTKQRDADETMDPFAGDDSFWDRGLTGKIPAEAMEEESQSILPPGKSILKTSKLQSGLSRLHTNRKKNGSAFEHVTKVAKEESQKDSTPVAIVKPSQSQGDIMERDQDKKDLTEDDRSDWEDYDHLLTQVDEKRMDDTTNKEEWENYDHLLTNEDIVDEDKVADDGEEWQNYDHLLLEQPPQPAQTAQG